MWKQVAAKVFGTRNQRELRKMMPLVAKINSLEDEFSKLSDDQIKAKTTEFKDRYKNGESLDDLLPEAFSVVREAAKRVMGMRHYDVQLLGGIVLHRGCIAEMRTGEGKTLTSTLAVYLNALTCKGVHVVTVNDYLATRDAEWMGRIYKWLGLTVGVIVHGLSDSDRRVAYGADITYGTNNEFGFDYLKDNMKHQVERLVHRGFNYAIVDEVDSVLIDEARTPLIISGPAEGDVGKYFEANQVVVKLKQDVDYTVDEKDHHAFFTEEGISHAERLLSVENLYDSANIEILHCLEQALKAHHLFKRDIDYLVENDQVVIIDSHTGRKMPGRRYSDGLHQALEAKEGVKVESENQTMASVTFQNFFRMYDKLAGMTGTAETEAPEFVSIYELEVFVIPTNKPIIRKDFNDQVFGTKEDKYQAIAKQIREYYEAGRPVLVGTIAIETSEYLSSLIRKEGVPHVVLNAKFHEQESEIVAQAGRKGAVTIATNMAGRGTDIILGGNPEMLARKEFNLKEGAEESDFEPIFAKYKKQCEIEKAEVLERGGLAILGTERHDSRRIDNQLRGRAGRQGDPGESKFFISLEDNLMRLFGNDRMKGILLKNMEPGVPIEHKMVSKAIERAQKAVEARNFESRKHVLEYDDVMNKQRKTFYGMRRQLMDENPREFLFERLEAVLGAFVDEIIAKQGASDEDLKKWSDSVFYYFNVRVESYPTRQNRDAYLSQLVEQLTAEYTERWDTLGLEEESIQGHERFIMLYVIDQQWKDHMRSMDHLKQSVGLQSYAQKDPLIEYKKSSFEMFNGLMDRIDEEVVRTFMHIQPKVNDSSVEQMRRRRENEARALRRAGSEEDSGKPKTVRRTQPKVGRNDPCPCGSGKKYKRCHGSTAVSVD